jgi:hypothetical protein
MGCAHTVNLLTGMNHGGEKIVLFNDMPNEFVSL